MTNRLIFIIFAVSTIHKVMTKAVLIERLKEDFPDKNEFIRGIMKDANKWGQVRLAYENNLKKDQITNILSVEKYGWQIMGEVRLAYEEGLME